MIPIIIVNWNGFDDTVACIESLTNSTYQYYHIYLVDNASDQKEGGRLKTLYKYRDDVEVWLSESNLGFAKANNWVLSTILNLDLPYLVLLNNDTIVDPEWLDKLLASAIKNKAQVISSKLVNFYNHSILDNAGHRMLNTAEIIPIGHGAASTQFENSSENLGACAAAALYDVEMIRDIGFFDDHFSTGYEDAELGLRAYLAGYRCLYEPSAKVYHKLGSSIKKVFDSNYAIMIQSSIWYTYFKLVPMPAMVVSLPFILVKQLLIVIINVIFFRWKYLGVQWSGWVQTTRYLPQILSARRAIKSKIRRGSWTLLSEQTFFLSYDLRRFVEVYLKGRKSAIDQYG